MNLVLKIDNLSSNDMDILLPKINLIKDKIYPSLEVNIKPHKIFFNQNIEDTEKALTLFKLLTNINYIKNKGIKFHCSLNETQTDKETIIIFKGS